MTSFPVDFEVAIIIVVLFDRHTSIAVTSQSNELNNTNVSNKNTFLIKGPLISVLKRAKNNILEICACE